MNQKLHTALILMSHGIRTGYSSVITFAYKELLNAEEQQELSLLLLQCAEESEVVIEEIDSRASSSIFSNEKYGRDGETP